MQNLLIVDTQKAKRKQKIQFFGMRHIVQFLLYVTIRRK